MPSISTRESSRRTPRSRRPGIAAPILSKVSAIAAIATRPRGLRWSLKTPRPTQAAQSTTGMRPILPPTPRRGSGAGRKRSWFNISRPARPAERALSWDPWRRSFTTVCPIFQIATSRRSPPTSSRSRPSLPTKPTGRRAKSSGENVYIEHCSFCHQLDGRGRAGAVPALAGNGAVQAKGPEDVLRVILGGHLATGTFAPMPAVGAGMTDQEIADVTDYVRTAWSNAAPVIQKTGLVADIRAKTVSGLAGPGAREDNNDPCLIGPNSTPVPWIDDPEINKTLAGINPESMLQTIPSLIARVKQVSPNKPQADIINGLMLAYCRIQAHTPHFL